MEPMGLEFGASIKRQRMSPMCDRVMLYVRQENEDIYTPLHVVPPTTSGLLNAVSLRLLFRLLSIDPKLILLRHSFNLQHQQHWSLIRTSFIQKY